jgi:hypothetical protein
MELYACYSLKLRDYIMSNGIRYKLIGLNPTSKAPFWVFIKTDDLSKCLSDWSLMTAKK